MSTHELKRRRGTTEEHKYFRGAMGELTVDTDKNTVVVHDGSTYGGHPLVTQRDLFEFLGKDYFINLEDLSESLKSKIESNIDIDYIESTYRKLETKIDREDMSENILSKLDKVLDIESEFSLFLKDISSSEISYESKKYGASLVGFCVLNNRFSKDVLTVQDAIDELALRVYNEEYNTSKLNNFISNFSVELHNYRESLEENNRKFHTYDNELIEFKKDDFIPLSERVQMNESKISVMEKSYYTKEEVENKISETFSSTSSIWETIEKLNEFFKDNSGVEDVIVSFYAQLSDEIKILQNNIGSLNNEFNTLSHDIEKMKPIYGSGIFNSVNGYKIYHYLNTLNYNVSITPTSNPNGKLGEIWVEKTRKECIVYCSGSTTLTTFDYLITESDRLQ